VAVGAPGSLPAPAPKVSWRALFVPSQWGRTFTSLEEPEYAWYFAGNLAFFMGMQMQMILRGFLAYDITGSATSLAWMAASVAIPMLVVAPFGGVTADRVNKRTLLIVTQSLAAIASLVIAVLIIADLIEFWHLVTISFATGLLFSFNMPARQALVPSLVPQHKLMNAISLQMGGMNLTRILAPAAGGLLIAPMGIGWVYAITFVLFVVAVASEFHLPRHGMLSQTEGKSFREDFTAGFRYIAGEPTIRLLMSAALIMPLFGFPLQQLLPVFAEDVFDRGALGLGFLAAAMGVGGLAGAMVSANLDNQPSKGRLMFIGGLVMGSFIMLFALTSNFYVALVLLVAMGVGQMLFQAVNNTAIQTIVPAEVRGRVMSVMMMSFGLMPLGVIPVAILADRIGPGPALAISASLLFLALFALWGASPRLRHLRLDALGTAELSPVQAAQLVAEGKLTQEQADRMTGKRPAGAPPAALPGG
jgi:MFS family permease